MGSGQGERRCWIKCNSHHLAFTPLALCAPSFPPDDAPFRILCLSVLQPIYFLNANHTSSSASFRLSALGLILLFVGSMRSPAQPHAGYPSSPSHIGQHNRDLLDHECRPPMSESQQTLYPPCCQCHLQQRGCQLP